MQNFPLHPALQIIRPKLMKPITGIALSTWYDKLNPNSPRFDPSAPKQIPLGARSRGWILSEVTEWLESCKERSRGVNA